MRSVSISLLLCLAAVLLTDVTCQRSSTCPCLKTTNTVVRKENIVEYKRQTAGVCHINAIVFTAIKKRKVCADPEKPWVKEAIEYVDNKKKAIKMTARPVNSTATYKTTPTSNATSHLNTAGCLKSLLT